MFSFGSQAWADSHFLKVTTAFIHHLSVLNKYFDYPFLLLSQLLETFRYWYKIVLVLKEKSSWTLDFFSIEF